ncbi:MAG TPA: hypothetical protein VNZ26_16730 [Vicinamibacterales bacterium]|jgi:hypothetical protein|nr:hypothetical protein [Vicinamibacterales bacterium]
MSDAEYFAAHQAADHKSFQCELRDSRVERLRNEAFRAHWSKTLIPLVMAVACGRSPVRPQIEPGKLDTLYRSIKAIEASTGVGVTYVKFGELLQAAATEVSIARDKATPGIEASIVADFDHVLDAYRDSATIWQRKNEDTGTGAWKPAILVAVGLSSDHRADSRPVPQPDPRPDRQMGSADSVQMHPVTRDPERVVAIVTKYRLPVIDTMRTLPSHTVAVERVIPSDSTQRIWAKASVDLSATVTKYMALQKP